MVKVEPRIFCYISLVLIEHIVGYLHISTQILFVTNFTIINKKLFFARI